ncbi:hypothetical protein STCU_02962 [Strigomonas culicis]|uniref:Uncharacterized protein n=1 Tax=Strigomonas culicis TaxID=28005 RepID=S9UTC5_9TRYP|nr:hypothetical protein STCU_02962 [Strigomonas culicis]|eukprot:EPY32128.1 hypothetical protein STCU_02962 [Strigomonas culicis]
MEQYGRTRSLQHLLPYLKGKRVHPFWQQSRWDTGVRGIFVRRAANTGDLLFSLPLRYCYFPTAVRAPEDTGTSSSGGQRDSSASLLRQQGRASRKPNRGGRLFPEGWLWLQRFSPDAKLGATQLSASVGLPSATGGVVSISVTPVEAMLATCVALRFFFTELVPLRSASRGTIGPTADALADTYVRTLPLAQYLERGIEGLYQTSAQDFEMSGGSHLALETVAYNLRDTILLHASSAEYNFYDQQASEFDALLLMALYMMRSRVLQVPLLHPEDAQLDRNVALFAPLLDGMNHAPASHCTAAAAVSLANHCVTVRATRPLPCGSEVTLDYNGRAPPRHARSRRARAPASAVSADNWWSTRYLMS